MITKIKIQYKYYNSEEIAQNVEPKEKKIENRQD